jgi:hypothetical protein
MLMLMSGSRRHFYLYLSESFPSVMSPDKGTESVASYSSIYKRDSFEDHTMWDRFSFDVDDDGLWLLHALLNGSLVIVHDGSFMPQLTSHACSCAFVLYCSSTDKRAIGSFAEESANADNYRGEWLGSTYWCSSASVLLVVISSLHSCKIHYHDRPAKFHNSL